MNKNGLEDSSDSVLAIITIRSAGVKHRTAAVSMRCCRYSAGVPVLSSLSFVYVGGIYWETTIITCARTGKASGVNRSDPVRLNLVPLLFLAGRLILFGCHRLDGRNGISRCRTVGAVTA